MCVWGGETPAQPRKGCIFPPPPQKSSPLEKAQGKEPEGEGGTEGPRSIQELPGGSPRRASGASRLWNEREEEKGSGFVWGGVPFQRMLLK